MMKKQAMVLLALTTALFVSPLKAEQATKSSPLPNLSQTKEVTFYVTRHGKTMFNTAHRMQGWSDTPLTAEGVKVAIQLGKGIKDVPFAAVYSSDSGRARETAKLVLAAAGQVKPVIETSLLRETCFGPYEGTLESVTWGPVAKSLGYEGFKPMLQGLAKNEINLDQMMDTLAATDSGGQTETAAQVRTRMKSELSAIAEKVSASGGGNVLVVSHGMAILTMLKGWAPDEQLRQQLDNASVTKITYLNGKFSVSKVGDMRYVEKGKQ
ncbi:histidine phosphatase family protein [Enterobacter cancerogenus]|uniref:histidine phosphatase family protein n=2 Tax=Enterobacterales TaxID=91347 RepID=UPI000536B305|nr:histidine phosphatase family protein [Enterobacter cancerogenus]KGT89323.1 hypothetical protein NH00_15815 [Enterobacter cancerogenus]